MNKGIITGVVRDADGNPVKGAVVQLISLKAGAMRLPIFNISQDVSDDVERRIHIVYSDNHGRYKIMFNWTKADIGEFLRETNIRVEIFALHSTKALRGNCVKEDGGNPRFYLAPDVQSLVGSILPSSFDAIDLADLRGLKLPNAFRTILTPRLSNMDMVGFAYCNIWLP